MIYVDNLIVPWDVLFAESFYGLFKKGIDLCLKMENNYWILRECQTTEISWESIDIGISNKYQFDISAEIICSGRLFVSNACSVVQVQLEVQKL